MKSSTTLSITWVALSIFAFKSTRENLGLKIRYNYRKICYLIRNQTQFAGHNSDIHQMRSAFGQLSLISHNIPKQISLNLMYSSMMAMMANILSISHSFATNNFFSSICLFYSGIVSIPSRDSL